MQHAVPMWLHQGGLIEAVRACPGPGGSAPLLIDSSTIDVESARVVSDAASAAGLEMLDAPVSGGVGGATAATLTFMVGGSETAFARGLPVLQAMGKNIVHAGGPGAGQAAKICNNMMLAINMVGVSEGFLLAQKLGLNKRLSAVKGCRGIGKRDMKLNDALPKLAIDPETYEVHADGVLLTCPPAPRVALARTYCLF